MSQLLADTICVPIQERVLKGREANSYKPIQESKTTIIDNEIEYINDISYGDTYPNSFFDIWRPLDAGKRKNIVIAFFHGGGFLFGDKIGGDPLAKSEDSSASILKGLTQNGYTIVSADYALAPEYRFPTQILQSNEFLHYIVENGEKYQLPIENLVLMGSSAGANLVEIYGTMLTNAEYAKTLGVKTLIDSNYVKGIIVDESALDISGSDRNMELLASAWLGVEPVFESKQIRLLNAVEWIKDDYPDTFVVSSNKEYVFEHNAILLEEKLKKVGSKIVYFDGTTCEEELEHGFLTRYRSCESAKRCFNLILEFLNEIKRQI